MAVAHSYCYKLLVHIMPLPREQGYSSKITQIPTVVGGDAKVCLPYFSHVQETATVRI